MLTPQMHLGLHEEIFIDNFAGGGGASTGVERGILRPVDHALNHCRRALAMHRMNHPTTVHHCEDIMQANPLKIAGDRRVGGIWFSPDCKHHSKARGGKPRDKKIRGLAWSVVHWVNVLRDRPAGPPRVIYLENVEEFQEWCPLLPDGTMSSWRKRWFFRCFTGAILRRGATAIEWAPGDGYIYRRTAHDIERLPGSKWSARACDHGAPTIRRRLYLIARFDGEPITWPEPTHAEPREAKKKRLRPHRTIAECLDFSLPCPSIFMTRAEAREFKQRTGITVKRPLVRATLARIANGVDRYVLKAKEPFIVSLTHQGEGNWPLSSIFEPGKTITAAHRGEKALVIPALAPIITEHANATGARSWPADQPLRTQCAEVKGGHFAAITPYLVHTAHGQVGKNGRPRRGRGARPATEPAAALTASNDLSLAAVHLTKFHGGATGSDAGEPGPTVTANSYVKRPGGSAPIGMVAASIVKMRGDAESHAPGHPVDQPGHTVSAGGKHHGLMAAYLAQHNGGANGHQTIGHAMGEPVSTLTGKCAQQQVVAAAMTKYYGTQQDPRMDEPAHTITTKDRIALLEMRGAMPPWTAEIEAGARRVAKFLRDHGVEFEGEFAMVGDYVIYDIGMRMLKARELFLAQGFPLGYVIDRGLDVDPETGRLVEVKLTGTEQVRMCGNSVCPPMAEALVAANNPEMRQEAVAA